MPDTETLPRKLNLGCGEDTRGSEWLDVDVTPGVDPDKVANLDSIPWDLPSDHFVFVEARHIVEHLDNPLQAIEEIAQILKPKGQLLLTYPLGHTRFEDATHRHFWNWNTAEQLTGDRKHGHETDLPLNLLHRSYECEVAGGEPLARWYTKYRLWRSGPGPWMSQVPGLYGEVTATYRKQS